MTLAHGDHACSVVASDAARTRAATEFVRDGIQAGDRICYVSAAASPADLCHLLAEQGLPVERALAEGQLVVATADRSYVARRTFDLEEVLGGMRRFIDDSLALGFPGVRITGEMDWSTRAGVGDADLVEYERRATEVFAGRPALAVCQYDTRVSSPDLVEQVKRVHPTLLEEPSEDGHPATIHEEQGGLCVRGDVDIDSRLLLATALDRLGERIEHEGVAECHLDLSEVTFIDVAGTMNLVRFAQDHPGCRVVLHAPPPCLTQVAEVLWPGRAWEVCP